ncbi:Protein of unknown function [Bacillus wiedmannii]|jgi:hypothetical protein
MAHD